MLYIFCLQFSQTDNFHWRIQGWGCSGCSPPGLIFFHFHAASANNYQISKVSYVLLSFQIYVMLSVFCVFMIVATHFAPTGSSTHRVGHVVGMVFFTLGLCLRFISCPHKRWFFLAPITILDILSLTGIILVVSELPRRWSLDWLTTTLVLLRVSHAFYLFRRARFARCLSYTITHGLKDFFYIILLYVFLALFFAFECYYAEIGKKDSQMSSISGDLWWVFLTMTTVGYGDVTPVGALGKHVAVFCSITGVFMYSLVAAAVLYRFDKYNSDVQYRRPKKPCVSCQCPKR